MPTVNIPALIQALSNSPTPYTDRVTALLKDVTMTDEQIARERAEWDDFIEDERRQQAKIDEYWERRAAQGDEE